MAQWIKNESGGFLQVVVKHGENLSQLNMPSQSIENIEPGQELEVKVTGDKLTVASGKNYVVREGRFQEAAGSTDVRRTVCQHCKKDTPMSAEKCPHCGAWNKYLHPEIQRFLDNKEKINVRSLLAWNFQHDREELAVTYNGIFRPRFHMLKAGGIGLGICLFTLIKWWNLFPKGIGEVVMLLQILLSVVGTIFLLYAGLGLLIWFWNIFVQAMAGMRPESHEKHLVINFATTPPQFQTNDERFWAAILEFFSLKK